MTLPPDGGGSIDHDLLQKMSDAYYGAMVDQLLEVVSQRTYNYGKALAFFRSCDNESDRAAPVLIFSFIENAIRELFSEELSSHTPGGVNSLFEPFGPLATTSARIKMLGALEWITPRTAKSLDILRKIRNEFAHDPPEDGFLDRKIGSLVANLHSYELPFIEPSFLKRLDLPNIDRRRVAGRPLFTVRAAFAFSEMIQELLSTPKALRMGLPAGAALSRGHNTLPQNLAEAPKLGIRVLLHTFFPDLPESRW